MSDSSPAPEPRPGNECWYCGSADLTRRIEVAQSHETGRVGLTYLGAGLLGIRALGSEPLRATLCNECGTVVRLSVAETDREWRQQPKG